MPAGRSKFAPVSGWNPNLYLRFEAYRTRPAADLLSRVDLEEAHFVVDLGGGPGNSTALLAERWPAAIIAGVDNSVAMLERARAAYPAIDWVQADLAGWRPPGRQDLIFANASFQWVSDHATLLEGLCTCLRTGGVLAFQVPSIHRQPAADVYRRLYGSTVPDVPAYHPKPAPKARTKSKKRARHR